MNFNFPVFGEFLILWLIWLALFAVVNITFAYGIFIDAAVMKRQANKNTFLVLHWI